MPDVKPKCATPEDALSCALLAATEQPLNVLLSDITFGRYAAEGAGWYWELQFTRRIGMTVGAGDGDSIERRIKTIVIRWGKEVGRYSAAADDDSGEQD